MEINRKKERMRKKKQKNKAKLTLEELTNLLLLRFK